MKKFKVIGKEKIKLSDFSTKPPKDNEDEKELKEAVRDNSKILADLQRKLYAQNKYGILAIFQGMDAAGKDSVIRNVFKGLNPEAMQVACFSSPTADELDHDYLWKAHRLVPERGRIGVFDRSYYEEVLIVRVHDLVNCRQLPNECVSTDIWQRRYKHILNFEEYLIDEGIIPIKFFLNISKEEQKKRLLDRINMPEKNWKFDASDLKERKYWNEYQEYYEETINTTSTKDCPWYVVPSDCKWYSRKVVSDILLKRIDELDLKYPELTNKQQKELEESKKKLEQM